MADAGSARARVNNLRTARMEAFSDGVFAIAIYIIVPPGMGRHLRAHHEVSP